MSEPTAAEPQDLSAHEEVSFLRSQNIALTTRLCDVLQQQVAQQQTVLIAAMQANLALTQAVEHLNSLVGSLSNGFEQLHQHIDGVGGGEAPKSPDFRDILSALMPMLSPKPGPQNAPAPAPAPAHDWAPDANRKTAEGGLGYTIEKKKKEKPE